MSSFRRRQPTSLLSGTKPSPYNSSHPLLSTGLLSLDDLLGGGLPLTSSLLVTGDDESTNYATLILKFWLSQGLECTEQDVWLISADRDDANELVEGLMDLDDRSEKDEELIRDKKEDEQAIKIAFRYKGMKKHQTSLERDAQRTPMQSTAAEPTGKQDVYCSLFDLTTKRNLSASERRRLSIIDANHYRSRVESAPADDGTEPAEDDWMLMIDYLEKRLESEGYLYDPSSATTPRPTKALRIAIHNFGSPSWAVTNQKDLYSFLYRLRPILRRSTASLLLTFPSTHYPRSTLTRLTHVSDSHLSLQAFSSSPTSLQAFPKHQGLLSLPKLPTISTLVPSSMKLSVLRGLGGGNGEGKDLGFRVKRRRFIVETLGGEGVVDWGAPKKEEVQKETAENVMNDEKKEKLSVGRLIHQKPELFEF